MNNKGFTLIELLISITILGFIILSVLYAESLSIHQTYMNEANMVAQQVLSYEMSYAHVWANEGNISWNSNTPQQISCTASSGIFRFETSPQNCLSISSISKVFNTIGTNSYSNISNILGSQYPMQIFLYADSNSSCQTTITGYVFWYYNDPGLQKQITPQITVDGLNIPHDSSLNNYLKNTENLTNIVCS